MPHSDYPNFDSPSQSSLELFNWLIDSGRLCRPRRFNDEYNHGITTKKSHPQVHPFFPSLNLPPYVRSVQTSPCISISWKTKVYAPSQLQTLCIVTRYFHDAWRRVAFFHCHFPIGSLAVQDRPRPSTSFIYFWFIIHIYPLRTANAALFLHDTIAHILDVLRTPTFNVHVHVQHHFLLTVHIYIPLHTFFNISPLKYLHTLQ